jgi:hypothetical protein
MHTHSPANHSTESSAQTSPESLTLPPPAKQGDDSPPFYHPSSRVVLNRS